MGRRSNGLSHRGQGSRIIRVKVRKARNRVTTGSTSISCLEHHDRAHWVPRAVPWLGSQEAKESGEAPGQPGRGCDWSREVIPTLKWELRVCPQNHACQRPWRGLPVTQGAGHDPVQLTGETQRQMSGAGPPWPGPPAPPTGRQQGPAPQGRAIGGGPFPTRCSEPITGEAWARQEGTVALTGHLLWARKWLCALQRPLTALTGRWVVISPFHR